MRGKMVAIVAFLAAFSVLLSPVSALTTTTNPQLPSEIKENSVVDFTLIITDIQGQTLTILTDLKQDGSTPIFDTSNLGDYQITLGGNWIKISPKPGQTFPDTLEIHIHGVVPEGVTTKVIYTPTNQKLVLKFFDLGEHIYYRVSDGIDSESKNFVIIHPQLEEVMNIINNNVTDPKAKQIAKEYIDLGLIDFVQNDLLPLFVKYDPQTFEEMSIKIQELENLVAQLNETAAQQQKLLEEKNSTIKDLSAQVSALQAENSKLKTQVSTLEEKVKTLEAQLNQTAKQRDDAKSRAKNFQIATAVLGLLVVIAGAVAYRSGKSSGFKAGFSQGRKRGYDEGYRKGEERGYERCMRECQSRNLLENEE